MILQQDMYYKPITTLFEKLSTIVYNTVKPVIEDYRREDKGFRACHILKDVVFLRS